MKYCQPAVIAALLSAIANPAWSGVPQGVQRSNTTGQQTNLRAPTNTTNSAANDECARMASVETEIASLRARIDDMLDELRARSPDKK